MPKHNHYPRLPDRDYRLRLPDCSYPTETYPLKVVCKISEISRETRLTAALLKLADALTYDHDIVELLQTLVDECVALFSMEAAVLTSADSKVGRRSVVSTSGPANLVQAIHTELLAGKLPALREAAHRQGFRTVYAVPMKLRDGVIGTLFLLSTNNVPLTARDSQAVQALADMATIGILQARRVSELRNLADQLQHALDNRILIEQAKGIVSQVGTLEMTDAFDAMRNYARSTSVRVNDVAARILDRSLDVATLMSATQLQDR